MQEKEILDLCIPNVDMNTTKADIFKVFKGMQLGFIKKITELPHKRSSSQKRIIFRLVGNKDDIMFAKMKEHLDTHGSVKLVYDIPWYWKIVPNNRQIKNDNICQ